MALSFGTNGVRGKLAELAPLAAFSLSAAFGQWCGGIGKTIVLGRDMRITSPMFAAASKAGLLFVGCRVLDIGLASAPTCEYILHSKKADGLIIITASHNPPEWNALKFVDKNGVGISRERGKEIEKIMQEGAQSAQWEKIGVCTEYENACKDHLNAMLKLLNADAFRSRSLSVVLDCGNGTSATVAPLLFQALGCKITVINGTIDGTFPGRPSEPTEANLQALISKVKETHADFGVGWDGDSDRVVFVDEKGRWIVGDKGFAISASLALQQAKASAGLQKRPLAIVTTVATSKVVEDVCKKLGGTLHYTKVGAPYISEKMRSLGKDCISGGEEVGGIVWPQLSLAKDGIFAAAKIAEAMCNMQMPLSAMLDWLPIYYNSKTKIECAPSQKEKTMRNLSEYAEKNSLHPLLLDGVRIDFPDSWVIVRASGTENYFRIFAEAKTQEKANALMEEYASLVKKLMA